MFPQTIGTLEEIAMPQNGINPPGILALADAFSENPNLRVLNLNDNTFTADGAATIAKVSIAPHIKELFGYQALPCRCQWQDFVAFK